MLHDPPLPEALAALIEWQASIGVDLIVDPAPHDRFAESARKAQGEQPSPRPSPAARERERPTPVIETTRNASREARESESEAAASARRLAASARDLDELREKLAAFDGCPLKAMANHFVFAAGTPGARIMILESAPGEEEERSGEPFSGAGGRLLDNVLKAIGLDRASAYLAYFSPWRPPGGQAPSPHVAATLLPFARRHVELAAPKALLLMGEPLAKAMLETTDVLRLRGSWFDCSCGASTASAALLPSVEAMLTSPSSKRRAWSALRQRLPLLSG